MSNKTKMLAFDFGASSGRAILGVFNGEMLDLQEIHRFPNEPVEIRGSLYWDILRLYHEIRQGIQKCANGGHRDLDSIAVDTWGVDFGLLDENGNLLCNPYHYRDVNTEGIMEEVFKLIPGDELYSKTGLQHMRFNTVFQLFSMKYRNLPAFKQAKTMLLTPDLFNYFLTGIKAAEYSIASTTELIDPYRGNWSVDIINKLGLPDYIFPDLVQTGSIIGGLSNEIVHESGILKAVVIATASHDTQSAIASVPAEGDDFAYISCGTWSLMGIESDSPIINEKSSLMAFTNEKGIEGKTTFLKNIMGLWLIQECKHQWDREGNNVSFTELEEMASAAKPFINFINPENDVFMAPGDMPSRIKIYCADTKQPVPETKGEIIRCIYQSIALKYKMTLDMLEEISGKQLNAIHMVGGGIKDKTLCAFTASATGRKVIAGPVEATSVGNLMIQALGLGKIKNLAEIRKVVKASFPTTAYEPVDTSAWLEAYEYYKRYIK